MTLGEYPDKVPPRYLIPLDAVPVAGPTSAGSRTSRRDVGLAARGPEPGRRERLRRLQRRRPARPLHDLARRRPRGLALRQPGRRHVRGPLRGRRARRPGLRPERRPGRLRQRRRPRRPPAPRRLGEADPALAPAEQGGRHLRGRDRRRRPGRADRDRVGRLGRLRQRRPARPLRLRRVPPARPSRAGPEPDPRNRCRLYHNQGDGTFVDVAAQAGVENERCAKGSAWGDYDGDGRLDLFVSNMGGPRRLYHNEGDGTFRDVAPELGDRRAAARLRLLVLGLRQRRPPRPLRQRLRRQPRRASWPTASACAGRRTQPPAALPQPRHGRASATSRREVGLDRPMPADGVQLRRHRQRRLPRPLPRHRLDVLLGPRPQPDCSRTSAAALRGRDRRRPAPATSRRGTASRSPTGTTTATSTSSSSWAAATPATAATTLLFQNPGHGRHWLKVRLVGTRTQPLGDRGQDPGRPEGGPTARPARSTGRSATTAASAATRLVELDRPARRRRRRSPDRHLADEQDRPRPSATSRPTGRSRSPRGPRRSRSFSTRRGVDGA